MQMRILSEADVRQAVDMPAAIDAMRDAFSILSSGQATVPIRLGLETEFGVSLFMPAHSLCWHTGFPGKRRAPKRTPKTTFWPANRCPGGQSVPH